MINLTHTRPRLTTALTLALALGALAVTAGPAAATSATATLTAGSLGFVGTPANVAFGSAALTGVNFSLTSPQAIDIGDATGSSAGWNITATSTTFTSGASTLPTSAVSIATAPALATCDASSTCSVATAGGVTYPYVLPAATTAPTATKMFSATAGTGLGDQTLTPTWTAAIPSKAIAGAYTSTWTLSLVSGP